MPLSRLSQFVTQAQYNQLSLIQQTWLSSPHINFLFRNFSMRFEHFLALKPYHFNALQTNAIFALLGKRVIPMESFLLFKPEEIALLGDGAVRTRLAEGGMTISDLFSMGTQKRQAIASAVANIHRLHSDDIDLVHEAVLSQALMLCYVLLGVANNLILQEIVRVERKHQILHSRFHDLEEFFLDLRGFNRSVRHTPDAYSPLLSPFLVRSMHDCLFEIMTLTQRLQRVHSTQSNLWETSLSLEQERRSISALIERSRQEPRFLSRLYRRERAVPAETDNVALPLTKPCP